MPPLWVLEFYPDEWVSVEDIAPPDYGFPEQWWRRYQAERRWNAAARRWWSEHRPGESLFTARQAHLRAGMVPLAA